jgi:predicted anti-sigma-YlaC factor YlaD
MTNASTAKHDHPDPVELELVRTGEGDQAVQAHICQCPQCQAELARLERLAGELATTPMPEPVSARADDAVLAAIERRAVEIRAQRLPVLRWRRQVWAAAALAALAIAGWLAWHLQQRHDLPPPKAVAQGDLNGDGTVDILDVYLLARQFEGKGAAPTPQGDGRTDRPEVAALAARAVKLTPGG